MQIPGGAEAAPDHLSTHCILIEFKIITSVLRVRERGSDQADALTRQQLARAENIHPHLALHSSQPSSQLPSPVTSGLVSAL